MSYEFTEGKYRAKLRTDFIDVSSGMSSKYVYSDAIEFNTKSQEFYHNGYHILYLNNQNVYFDEHFQWNDQSNYSIFMEIGETITWNVLDAPYGIETITSSRCIEGDGVSLSNKTITAIHAGITWIQLYRNDVFPQPPIGMGGIIIAISVLPQNGIIFSVPNCNISNIGKVELLYASDFNPDTILLNSSDTSILRVRNYGNSLSFRPINYGTATVTATATKDNITYTDSCVITVDKLISVGLGEFIR